MTDSPSVESEHEVARALVESSDLPFTEEPIDAGAADAAWRFLVDSATVIADVYVCLENTTREAVLSALGPPSGDQLPAVAQNGALVYRVEQRVEGDDARASALAVAGALGGEEEG